jgi:multisubunit Na+/H+ antiporter MnhC subunit
VALDTNYFESAKIISSVNTILRESVSLFCLIGGLKENHYLTQTSGISMAIIWISSHLDTGVELLYTTSLFLTSHVLQLMVTLIALSFAYLIRDNVKTDKSEQFPKDKETDCLTKIDAIV